MLLYLEDPEARTGTHIVHSARDSRKRGRSRDVRQKREGSQ